jgi:hypothetical protein
MLRYSIERHFYFASGGVLCLLPAGYLTGNLCIGVKSTGSGIRKLFQVLMDILRRDLGYGLLLMVMTTHLPLIIKLDIPVVSSSANISIFPLISAWGI